MRNAFSALVDSEREPTRDEIAALARTYLVGPVDDSTIDRLDRQFRAVYANVDERRSEGSAFRGNGVRYLGQAWKELLSPHNGRPSPAELAVWLAVTTEGYPAPRLFCPPQLAGSWRQQDSSATWELAPNGDFQTTDSRIASLGVTRWCVHYVERRGDFHRDELWLLDNARHNIAPRALIIVECTDKKLRMLRPSAEGSIEYVLERSS